jgi:hypothetical protein
MTEMPEAFKRLENSRINHALNELRLTDCRERFDLALYPLEKEFKFD